ncbi:MAG TPA: hypothetical protein VFA29_03795, partial [Candidatus Baltobacteraceae bacterium]|nr:hypothetical protein [Candidatus Baltobacteraceae bacterium]
KFIGGRGNGGVFSWYDTGLLIGRDGTVREVRDGSPAWKAGLSQDMQIVAVNGRAFAPDLWTNAITDAKTSSAPIHLRVKQAGYFQRIDLPYHDGLRYPHLQRVAGTTDMLTQIMTPRIPVPSPSPSASASPAAGS